MRIAVRWIHGWAIPEQIAVPSIKDAFNEDGLLKNELLMERLENMMESLFQTTLLFKNK